MTERTERRKARIESQRATTSERLREAMKSRNVRQAELLRALAEKEMNMTSAQLSQTVNGKRTLQNDYAKAIAEILGVDPGYLLGIDSVAEETSESEHTCEFCYYEYFDARAYPCSMCVMGEERTDMFQPKMRGGAE